MAQTRNPIVISPTEVPEEFDGDFFEAGFSRLRSISPKVSNPDSAQRLLRALGYCLRRQPTNLLAHIQYINLLRTEKVDAQRAFEATAALLDILNGRGAALRERVLGQVFPLLNEGQQGVLQAASLPKEEVLPSDEPTELSIVIPFDHHTAAETDPVSYADELLCLGDYVEAMAVLEKALAKSPDSAAIAEPLQVIYRSARDREAYERSRTAVLAAAPQAASLWPEADIFFGGR